MSTRKRIEMITDYIILIAMMLITIFPIVYTVASSFKTNMEILTKPANIFPENPTLQNYITAFTSEVFNVPLLLKNSVIYTLFSVFVAVVISSMAGYVFARGHFRFKKFIFACFSSLMFIKVGGIGIYATFQILNALHLYSSLYSLMFIGIFCVPVVNIYLVKGNVESIPVEIDDAAKMDGCSFIQIYFRIILPLLKPILATIAIMAFQSSWNEYLMPNIFTITKPEQRTLIVGLMALKATEGATSWNLMLAGATISLMPILVAFAFANKYFVKGIAAGAIKG